MNFKNAILIQARVGSSRLKSKVLFKINGLSILEIGYKRLKKVTKVKQIIYLIPSSKENLVLKKEIESFGGLVFLGSEKDLIKRYLDCADFYNIQNIIRITSDCPLVDPYEVDKFFSIYEIMNNNNLYLSNYTPPELASYCNGSDIEIFSTKMLKEASKIFNSDKDREHVTFQFWDGRFPCNHLKIGWQEELKINDVRLTVDYEEDIEVIKLLAKEINLKDTRLIDICKTYKKLNLNKINGHFDSKAGWQ
tara:strand:- start:2323 stop:3072 length:750 start_codon:yes stop_codon:yes gene_type:complete